jgi:aldehyde:ferredoxin oxidoreductase
MVMHVDGWAGKILYINLGEQKTYVEDTSKYSEYIGGRGINQFLLFQMSNPKAEPLDPQNVVILGAGPMVGTLIPANCRLSVDFKNVVSGGVGSGNCGGQFAAEMKFAGYDHIVITGKSKAPVYLYIHNDRVLFRPAGHLWGKTTWETENIIKKEEKENAIKTLTIGPAGENLVKIAAIISDRGRAAAYGGGGAVFGSKNLKAVAIRGTNDVKAAHPQELLKKLRQYRTEVIEKSEMVKVHRKGGTLLAYQLLGDQRTHGVRNMSDEYWSNENILSVSRQTLDKKFLNRRHSCFGCPVFCSGIFQVNGKPFEGFHANSYRSFVSNIDLKDPEMALTAHTLTNLYGLDGDQTSSVIAWAMECYENGILTTQDTDGLKLNWGNGESVIALIKKIALRQGFGNILADGVYEAAKNISKGSEKLAVVVKKTGLMEANMRPNKGWALGVVTSTKGGGHLRGAIAKDNRSISAQTIREIFDMDDIGSPTSYDHKAALVAWQESYKSVIDMMGICALTSIWMDITLYSPKDIAHFFYLLTGVEKSAQELLTAGRKIQNLERAFNLLHAGYGRPDDMPPEKLITVPVSAGPYQGEKLDIEKWNKMLSEYYAHHHWDTETGWPTKKCLEDLNLDFVIDKLNLHNITLSES